ncbi:MAG: DUF664 domain-containing protein [Frankiales bacterium]|nr:DUF664 domain-containing protein [Frankiales bacterium]
MTWTAPAVERAPSPHLGTERESLQGWLDFQRQTLLWKCAGLTHEQLATRSVEPSTLSLLGLVRHMADVERWWFRINLRGEDVACFFDPDETGADFDDLGSLPAEEVFAVFERECVDADAAAYGLPLEQRFRTRRDNELDLRWVYLHMIEEYARHNGHADLLRERIDGQTGD